jgi:ubiquinone/menaquinone biosynthesis C-methylase UbiE
VLTHEQARRVYDRIGALQDSQGFYEARAVRLLVRHADFASAHTVFELGCGTGRFARRLLTGCLPSDASYRATDLSPKMVRLARRRLEPFLARASVTLSEGGAPDAEPAASIDRFVSNYVLDLLPEAEIRAVLGCARRMLRPGGRLCLVSLTTGVGRASRVIARGWTWLQARWPAAVGGCRPLELRTYLRGDEWTIRFQQKVVSFGVPSEVVVAEPATPREC